MTKQWSLLLLLHAQSLRSVLPQVSWRRKLALDVVQDEVVVRVGQTTLSVRVPTWRGGTKVPNRSAHTTSMKRRTCQTAGLADLGEKNQLFKKLGSIQC